MTRCYAYTRVSTAKQGEGVSLEAQREAIETYAARHDLKIVGWFEEKQTAAKRGRPVFARMIRELRKGRAQGLLIHKIDRSARNFSDWGAIHDLADSGVGIFVAADDLDFRSRGGRLTADIQAVIAADYIRNLRDETLKGMNGRLKQGLYPWNAPIGYLNNGGGKPKTPDPLRAPLIRQIFELYASEQHSIWSLVAEMEARGLRTALGKRLSKTGIATILSNPFYCGLIRLKSSGATYKGIHEPLISAELFERVQDIKSGKAGKQVTRHDHLYQGMFRCGLCGNPMSPELQKGHVYYRCHRSGCETRSIREEALDDAVDDLMLKLIFDDEQEARIDNTIMGWLDRERNEGEEHALKAELAKLDTRLETLTTKLVDGVIDDETFAKTKERFLLERLSLEQRYRDVTDRGDQRDTLRRFVELSKTLYFQYKYANKHEKRRLLNLASSNRTVSGKDVEITPADWVLDLTLGLSVLCGGPRTVTCRTFGTQKHIEQVLERWCGVYGRFRAKALK